MLFKSHPESILSQQGLTLVEAVVAMLMFLVALGGIAPLFMSYTFNAFNNKLQTGAIAISQELLDELREYDISELPNSGTATQLPLPSTESIATISYLGRDYNPRIIYCQNATFCDANSRHIKVEVDYDGATIYETETIYTDFE